MYVKNLTSESRRLTYKGAFLNIAPDGKYHIIPDKPFVSPFFHVVVPSVKQIVTLVMPLKDRSQMALKALQNVVSAFSSEYFKFIIVEARSNNPLVIPEAYKPYIDHYYVNAGAGWNRAKLLNYGFRRAETPLVAGWDVDFRFSKRFYSYYLEMIASYDFTSGYTSIVTTETDNCIRQGKKIPKGSPYGGFHTHFRKHVDDLNGYDEKFKDFGWEEIDFLTRVSRHVDPENWKLYVNKSYNEYRNKDLIWHKSHSDYFRSKDFKRLNKNKKLLMKHYEKNVTVLNQPNWGKTCTILKFNGERINS